MIRFIPLFRALVALCLGLLIGILILESLLHINPQLLFRGMAVTSPVEPPLTRQTYDVRYSDADVFTWRPDLVRPFPPGEDKLEAHVVFETDEFGFRNRPPTSEKVDVVVLGRSISMAAHLPKAWPEIFEGITSKKILNLSYPGGNLLSKKTLLQKYGFPHRPEWIVVEIVPSIDINNDQELPPLMIRQVITPMIQNILRKTHWGKFSNSEVSPIYPLQISLPNRDIQLTCCLHYMEFFTLDAQTLEKSRDWAAFRSQLLEITDLARRNQACVALLIAPTKPDIYFPLAEEPDQLEPTLLHTTPLSLGLDGFLVPDPDKTVAVETIVSNAFVGQDLIHKFAHENNIPIIDPTGIMAAAVLEGKDPFMQYDSHWNSLGHKLVAQSAAEVLSRSICP